MNILKAFIDDEKINYNVNILGTFEEPLFQANHIAHILGINNLSQCVSKYDETEKVYKKIETNGGTQEVIFLTEMGLYRMIFKSKKKFAEKFRKWGFNIIRENRIYGKNNLNMSHEEDRKLLEEQKEYEIQKNIIHNTKNKHVIYLSKIDEKNGKMLIKIGSSKDIKQRAPQLVSEFGKSVILQAYPCVQNMDFELFLHKHNEISIHRYKESVNGKISRELFLLDKDTYEKLLIIIRNNIHRFNNNTVEEQIKLHQLEIDTVRLKNEKIRLDNERIKLENERIALEKEIKYIELIKENPSCNLQKNDIDIYEKNKVNESNEDKNKYEEDINEEDELLFSSTFQTKKYKNSFNPKVQQYHPETLEYIKTFDSIIETVRYFCNELHIKTFSNRTLKSAFQGNYVYAGYRWNIIEYNVEDKPYIIPPTVKIFTTRRDLLARINIEKTQIIEVYPSQKDAAIAMKHKSSSALSKALKHETLSQGHYWKFYDDCSEELKNEYIQRGGIVPEVAVTISGAKPIQQIDYETKKVIATYRTIKEAQVKYNISRTCIKNAIETKTPHHGFYWAYA